MKYIDYSNFSLENSAVCLGKFDGLHIGHRELIDYSVALKEEGYQSVIFTFLMNPRLLRNPGDFFEIYTEQEKRKLLENMGVDVLVSFPFDKEMFAMEPEDFVLDILIDKLDTKVVIVGNDFRFGHNRSGDVSYLKKMGKDYGFLVKSFDKVEFEEEIVSSTRIRNCIIKGDIEKANKMLGQPYCFIAEVLHGRKIGRTLGMPTINMVPADTKLLPPNGVYASNTWLDGKPYAGISNIGVKPTVGAEEKRLMETYIFDYTGDLYGRKLKVDLFVFERPERKFASLNELKEQMEKDTAFGKSYLGSM